MSAPVLLSHLKGNFQFHNFLSVFKRNFHQYGNLFQVIEVQ